MSDAKYLSIVKHSLLLFLLIILAWQQSVLKGEPETKLREKKGNPGVLTKFEKGILIKVCHSR